MNKNKKWNTEQRANKQINEQKCDDKRETINSGNRFLQ